MASLAGDVPHVVGMCACCWTASIDASVEQQVSRHDAGRNLWSYAWLVYWNHLAMSARQPCCNVDMAVELA